MRVEPVSAREAEVLTLLGEHLSNAEIAGSMHISVRTVEHHVSALLRKLGVADRRALGRLVGPVAPAVTGVPVARDSFVGRAHERDSLLAHIEEPGLVTLLGPGGVGKTRLAAEIAAAAPCGGAFVDLLPVRDGFVDQAVAAAVGVTEGARQPLREALIERLRGGRVLLVLDNCEHVVDAVAEFVDRVLTGCPESAVLVTSRQRLNVPGERVVPIGPLPLAADAEALFLDRARAVDPAFTADPAQVALLCARLDGMPLAIELAAARSASLGVVGLLTGLDDYLRLLDGGRGGPERHRSLRSVIGWSHELLDDAERALFRRLAAFVGAFDLPAAATVADLPPAVVADVLGRLADKSLVARVADGRWRLLATVRAYAAERLADAGESVEVSGRRLAWAAATAEELLGRRRSDPGWSDEFDAVADDLRAALRDAAPGREPVAHRLARALARLAYARRFLSEAVEHATGAAQRAPEPRAAAADLRLAASATFAVAPAGAAFDLLCASEGDAAALARAVVIANRFPSGFDVDVPHDRLVRLLPDLVPADAVAAAHHAAARAWNATGEKYRPDPALAEQAVAAARATGDPVLLSGALDALGAVASNAGRLGETRRIAVRRVALLERMDRDDPEAAAEILDVRHNAWLSALEVGDLRAALEAAETIMTDDLLGIHPYRPLCKVVPPLMLLGRFADGLRHAEPMWTAWRRSGAPVAAWLAPAAASVAMAYGVRGDDTGFHRWLARADQVTGPGNPMLAERHAGFAAFVAARVALHRWPDADPDLPSAANPGPFQTYVVAAAAELAVAAGCPDGAERLVAAEWAGAENRWAAACLNRARGRLHGDRAALARAAAGFERIGARFERTCTLELLRETGGMAARKVGVLEAGQGGPGRGGKAPDIALSP
ncbi:LuxR C-terminal-related transcriptional regulator [Asanoa sp. NPDC049518]|uniref:ATP-binding protein n=1 Tax=unclassified Asanoa TaxID=2685164 RepID=UPI00341C11F3